MRVSAADCANVASFCAAATGSLNVASPKDSQSQLVLPVPPAPLGGGRLWVQWCLHFRIVTFFGLGLKLGLARFFSRRFVRRCFVRRTKKKRTHGRVIEKMPGPMRAHLHGGSGQAGVVPAKLSGHQLMAKLDMEERAVEPKGSCWLLSFLDCFTGALENAKDPSLKDRMLDWYVRNEIWQQMHRDLLERWAEREDGQLMEVTRMLLGLYKLPYAARARNKDTNGWSPNSGWAGSAAFDYLASCAPTQTIQPITARHRSVIRVPV